MQSIYSALVLLTIFLATSAFAEYGQYPGATWERHAYDRSRSFDHNRQCDENGCLITNTQEQYQRQVDQYYIPRAQPQTYYQPQTENTYRYQTGSNSYRTYLDTNGNPTSREEYYRLADKYRDWANKHGTKREKRKAAALYVD